MRKKNVSGLSQFAAVKEEKIAPASNEPPPFDGRKKNKDNRIGVTVRLLEDDWEWLSEHAIKTRESLQKMSLRGLDMLLKSRGLRGLKEIEELDNQ
jgi:hypothetical protein